METIEICLHDIVVNSEMVQGLISQGYVVYGFVDQGEYEIWATKARIDDSPYGQAWFMFLPRGEGEKCGIRIFFMVGKVDYSERKRELD